MPGSERLRALMERAVEPGALASAHRRAAFANKVNVRLPPGSEMRRAIYMDLLPLGDCAGWLQPC